MFTHEILLALVIFLVATGFQDDSRIAELQQEITGDPLPVVPPNILLVVLDDTGVDVIPAYGEGPGQPACTPWLDALASGGVLFQNAWADPLCSPSRAQILTGRHGFRTGVGQVINGNDPSAFAGLPTTEQTLAEALLTRGYSCGAFGKWHLATASLNPADPLLHGFGWYQGAVRPFNPLPGGCPTCPPGCQTLPLGYYRWVKSTNGVEACETRYATTVTVDDAIAAVTTRLPEPWFLYVSMYAIHSPFHVPPASLCPGASPCACGSSPETNTELAKASLEAADAELRRLTDALEAASQGPMVVLVIGDNGTSGAVTEGTIGGCFDPQRSKGTPYEGGVNVPLIVGGDGVVPGESPALVSATDLFATVVELAGGSASAEDSVSLVPYLRGFSGALRQTVYAERFTPNGLPFAPTNHQQAIRDARYKLIRRTDAPDELYDLLLDPCETTNLFPPPPGSPEEAAWLALDAELAGLDAGEGARRP